MRIISKIFSCLVALVILCACGDKPTAPLKEFVVREVVPCSHISQDLEIKFSFDQSDSGKQLRYSVVSNADWIKSIDTSSNEIIKLSVEENSGNIRTAKITLSALGYKSVNIEIKQYGIPAEEANHTLMFYFFGTSLNRYFKANIADATAAIKSGILGVNNRVIYFRQESKNEGYIAEVCYDLTSGECFENIIEEGIIIDDELISTEFISNIIDKMGTAAPAKRYGMVIAGHGQGWITREVLNGVGGVALLNYSEPLFVPALGAEVTRALGENNVQVNPDELAEGINNSVIDIDYLLFDACFMSSIEAIYELRNSANYIIASPCEIMGKGFPYERTLPHLFKDDGMVTDYTAAAESYHLYYRDEYHSSMRCGSIAVYDCSEIEALRDATKEVVRSAKSLDITSTLQTYEGKNPHYFYDFGEWVNAIATDSNAQSAFNTQLNKTVIAKYSLESFYSAYGSYGNYPIDLEVYSGVTTSAPSTILQPHWVETEWYKSVWEL